MADEVDKSAVNQETIETAQIENIRAAASKFELGCPGDCDKCGEWFSRIVRGHCARCRDLLKLP